MLGEKEDSKKNDERADKCKKLFERKAGEWNRSERENWVGRGERILTRKQRKQ